MRIMISRFVLITVAGLATLAPLSATAQTSPGSSSSDTPVASQAQTPAADPLTVANQAIAKGDYAAAQTIVNAYLKDNPDNPQALFAAGSAFLGLKQYDDADKSYLAAIKAQPPFWPAHKNLVIVYAAEGKWTDFDRERALLRDATAKGEDGLNAKVPDVIDVIYVGTERYIVRAFPELNGKFHTRYNFVHFGSDGKRDFWIECESDDADQAFFAQKHPQEAAAGQRSFSLDSYTAPKLNPDGKTYSLTHGTIKFYPDGEPTYEMVRADVVKVLENKTAPMVKSTVAKPSAPDVPPPAPQ
jgi:hypothetical protein